ncbi:MAG: FecR domain-containing protein [Candidatus Obscuribacterales bacterium]|nr:FecR domain-containing protein [Candidatus Obscuribacterales bacterium]
MATGPKFLALILSLVVSCPWAGAATPASSSAISAKVAETHGTVFKRGFVDWEKDEWADPEPARPGDNLDEGMQVGTGDKSWAEVTWPNVTTRAWANSVFAIAPNQRLVYLLGGQMLFNLDKHRKDKKDFFVWTKVLQARIRGTTVMVQATHDVSRITVLEGVVEVMNRLDKSVIRLNPGAVYEVRTPGSNPLPPISQAQPTATPAATNPAEDIVETTDETANEQIPIKLTDKPTGRLAEIANNLKDAVFHDGIEAIENASYDGGVKVKPKLLLADLHEMTAPGQAPIMVFSDAKAETRLYPADAKGLLLHPLVQGFNFKLPSLALVQNSLNNLPPLLPPPNPNITSNLPILTNPLVTPSDTITGVVDAANIQVAQPTVQTASILKVPMADQYLVGPLVGYALPLPPQAFTGYLPAGVLTGAVETLTGNISSTNLRGQTPTNPMPQGTFVPPTTANIPQMTNFIPPTTNLPQTTNFIPPTTAPLPQVTNFVPPTTAPLPQLTNFVPPTTSVPQVTNFVPPTTAMPQMTNFVPPTATMPTMTMPVVNTFIPPTTTMPVVNSFIPPSTVNTTATMGSPININTTAPMTGGNFTIQSGLTLPK